MTTTWVKLMVGGIESWVRFDDHFTSEFLPDDKPEGQLQGSGAYILCASGGLAGGASCGGQPKPDHHNQLAKIYIDTHRNPKTFLRTNAFYDSKLLGKYCEDRNKAQLAFTAYRRAGGSCDKELVELTNKNGLLQMQARYLVQRQSQDLWGLVRQGVRSRSPDEVAATVEAFNRADLPQELIEPLEKMVIHSSDFSGIRKLQNLLILTAIKADKGRVMGYIHRLDNCDGPSSATSTRRPWPSTRSDGEAFTE
ncbi:unnamed protein product [Vitrella brassicaformis CCMP3155]|uniref:Uncharacterized protein n=1 Tax=Vitrella brassicaformis (strain CCMP3155) TaxID=1169540 RepID=A0A0G4FFF3_VITBC|nr:unnamed protein product [Vitrella brassicaformis CCMP3155]|eukprot:CEM11891.1 unnamed protein product [Vitrella brassicaformis CCMP3155]